MAELLVRGDLSIWVPASGTTANFYAKGLATNIDIYVQPKGTGKFRSLGAIQTGSKSADPSGANGDFYYNTTTNKFRAYENGAWVDMIGGGGGGISDGDKGDITVTSSGATWTIDNGVVTFAKIVSSAAAGLSVIGRSTNSAGVFAEINAANDAEVLRRSGTTLGFGTIATAGIANSAVTLAKLANGTALSVLGRSANSSGVYADIAAGTDNHILRRSGTTIGFGTVTATAGGLTQATARLLGRTTASTGAVEAIALGSNEGLQFGTQTLGIGGTISSTSNLSLIPSSQWQISSFSGTSNDFFSFSLESNPTLYRVYMDAGADNLNVSGLTIEPEVTTLRSRADWDGISAYEFEAAVRTDTQAVILSVDNIATGNDCDIRVFDDEIILMANGNDRLKVTVGGTYITNEFYPFQSTTGSMGSAVGREGSIRYNTTTKKPVYSDGTNWVDIGTGGGGGGGTPGGSDTQVQYNSGGTFAGSSGLVWNNTDAVLTTTRYGHTGLSAAPSGSVANGQMYYDTTELDFRGRINGQWNNLTRPRIVVTSSTTVTLDETYRNAIVVCTAASTVTVNGPSLSLGFTVTLIKANTGNVQFVPTGGTTLDATSDTIITIHTSATFFKKTSTVWQGTGSLENPGGAGQVIYWGAGGIDSEAAFSYDNSANRVTVPVVNTAPAAGDISSPSNGDIWYNSTTGKFRARQGGSTVDLITAAGAGTVTSVNVTSTSGLSFSGGPITSSGTITMSGTLLSSFGGTGLTSYTAGDILYYASGTALSKLAAAASGNALLSGTAPSWGKIGLTTHVSGILGTANGGLGTALTDPNADRIIFWDDSAGSHAYLTLGSGLSITGTTINAASGLTNSAANTQLAMSDGTNLVNSEVYITNPSGTSINMGIGNPSAGNVVSSITAQGSGSTVSLELNSKGDIDMELTAKEFYFNSAVGISYIFLRSSTTASRLSPFNNTSFEIDGGDGTSVTINGASLTIRAGDAYGISGSGNGGHLILRTTDPGPSGGSRGQIMIQDLPTSSAGLPSNSIWNDSGTLKIIP